jgi:hypothetical protein
MAGMRARLRTAWLERPHVGLASLGTVLVWVSSLAGSGFSPISLPFAIWSTLPYGVLWIVGSRMRDRWLTLGAGAAAIAADLGIRAAVFVWPRGSTAAIALVFSPAYITAVIMPVGAAAGWLLGRMWRWHMAGRVAALTIGPIGLGLMMLGLARPELFPSTVLARRALLQRIGPPRIVVGSDAFTSAPVSTQSAWYIATDLDEQAGEELIIVDSAGADVLDSATLAVKRHVAFGGQPGRLWASFSTLVRLPDGRLAVAQTGGGFSRTLLQDLNGAELWEYRPDPKLPPTALRPADLDADGNVEFYGASTDSIVRLDSNGREVWRRPATLAALLATMPRAGDLPPWIAAVEYGRKLFVWDAAGRPLIERAVSAEDSPLSIVDTFAGRGFIHGGHAARAYDLEGKPLFDVPLGDFTLSFALGVRFSSSAAPHLVLVGSTDRDTSRYRLLIVNPDRRTVYDEIFDRYPRVLAARQADGSDTLFIRDAPGLRQLRPR